MDDLMVKIIEQSKEEKDKGKRAKILAEIAEKTCGDRLEVKISVSNGVLLRSKDEDNHLYILVMSNPNIRRVIVDSPNYWDDAIRLAKAYEKDGEEWTVLTCYP